MLLDSQNAFLLNPLLRQCLIYSFICFEVYRLNRCIVTVGSSIACFFGQQKYCAFKPLSRCTWWYAYLDTKIGHYAKILMDEIFGEDHFINEIVWHYNKFA